MRPLITAFCLMLLCQQLAAQTADVATKPIVSPSNTAPDLATISQRSSVAMAAYAARDYAQCAAILTELSGSPLLKSTTIPYNAACCQSLNGKPEAAVPLLERAASLSLLAVADVDRDTDLASLRALPEWPALRKRLATAENRWLAGVNRPLRNELLAREVKDQDIRRRAMVAGNPPPKALIEEWRRIDADNTAWMKTVLAKHGWPGKSLVGKDGAKAAWLFVQHADMDRPFQKQAVKLLESAVAKGEAEGSDLAYLQDRILVGEDKPQRYGTQYHTVDGKLVPTPIEDPAQVDARRAAVGLGSLADYDRMMQGMQKKP